MKHTEKLLRGLKSGVTLSECDKERMKDAILGRIKIEQMSRYDLLVELTKHLQGKEHLELIKDAPTESLMGLLLWYQGEKRRRHYHAQM